MTVTGSNRFLFQAGWLLLASGFPVVAMAAQPAPGGDAAGYPNRPIRLITPAAPGGTTDFLARMLAARLTETWKQQTIVDNRASASGVTAAEITRSAAPDGYTLFIGYHQHTVNAAIIPKLQYHPVNDFTPITQMTAAGLMLVVNPSHPSKTLKDFVAWTRTTREPINIGSAGIGSGGHLAGELYKLMAGIKAQHIPYKGAGPALIDLVAGNYHFSFAGLVGALGQVRAGRLRALAVTSPKRLQVAPDVPAVAEVLPGFEVVGWYGLLAPPKLPQPLVAKLHAETVAFVRSADFRKRIENEGGEAVGSDSETFREFMLADLKKWADVVKRSGAKFE